MLLSINNPVQDTIIFSVILGLTLLFSIRSRKISEWLPASLTAELKGLAILMIVLSHIGYFLVTDNRFLWPLSIAAGLGVNLFLFLSGFGLTASQMQKDLTPGQFYKRRILKIFTPFWLMLIVVLALDFFILKINYSWQFLGKAAVGIFNHADLYQDFDSPLWYFTFIIGYYLLFPLVFFKKRPWLSALILALAGFLLVLWSPSDFHLMYLYSDHIFAFPLGVLAAWLVTKLRGADILETLSSGWKAIIYYLCTAALLGVFIYATINSGVGTGWEQTISIIAMLAIILVFIAKKIEFRLLSLFGLYSYEIYLWHWPLLYRYDIFYSWLPAWAATVVYLAFFIAIGWMAQRIVGLVNNKK